MQDIFRNTGTFTRNAWEWLYETVDHDQFHTRNAELIYESLERDFHPVHFGNYLQHYIFKKLGMSGTYSDISLRDYQTIIQDAFRDNGTPPAFTPTTAKLGALAKNWLTQQSVKRQVVLLLGFGLKMSVDWTIAPVFDAVSGIWLGQQSAPQLLTLTGGFSYF